MSEIMESKWDINNNQTLLDQDQKKGLRKIW